MIGTESGCWFSFRNLSDDLVSWEFFRGGTKLEEGIGTLDQMTDAFMAIETAAQLPLQ